MPIPSQTPYAEHTGNGVTTSFAYEFTVLSADDMRVKVDGATVSTGFTVSGVGSRSGGAVVFSVAPASLASVYLYREVSLAREIDYQENGDLLAETLDDDFDRVWMALQDRANAESRSIRAPIGETLTELPTAAGRASKYLGFDSGGNRVLLDAPSASDASALVLALADQIDPAKGADLIGYEGRTVRARLADSVSVKDFGAVGDGVADDTAAFALARAAVEVAGGAWAIYAPRGTYLLNNATFSYFTTIVGESHVSTKFKPYLAGGTALNFEYYPTVSTSNNLAGGVHNVTFLGTGTRQGTGITLGNPSVKPSDAHAINSMDFKNLRFENLEYGLRKPYGQIAQRYDRCTFFNCDFGYYASFDALMHSGLDKFDMCMFIECKKFAFYSNKPWLTEVGHCWFELNRGVAIFIAATDNVPTYKNAVIRNTWFEGNGALHPAGPFPTVTVGATTYSTADIYCESARTVDVEDCQLMYAYLLGTILSVRNCVVNGSQLNVTRDAKSAVVFNGMSLDGQIRLDHVYETVVEPDNFGACAWRAPHRVVNSYAFSEKVLKKVLLNGSSVNFGNSLGGTIATTPVADGVIFDTSQELVIPSGANASWTGAGFTMAADRYYVITLDVKCVSNPGTTSSNGVFLRYEGGATIGGFGEFYSLPSSSASGRWHTLVSMYSNVGVGAVTNTFNATIYNRTGASFTVRLSALQVLEFADRQDAINFINSRVYAGK